MVVQQGAVIKTMRMLMPSFRVHGATKGVLSFYFSVGIFLSLLNLARALGARRGFLHHIPLVVRKCREIL